MRASIAFVAASVGLVAVACSQGEPGPPPDASGTPPSTTDPTPATAPATSPRVTFHRDVEPLLQKHCQGCHEQGGLAPFALTTYESASAVAALIASKTHV